MPNHSRICKMFKFFLSHNISGLCKLCSAKLREVTGRFNIEDEIGMNSLLDIISLLLWYFLCLLNTYNFLEVPEVNNKLPLFIGQMCVLINTDQF